MEMLRFERELPTYAEPVSIGDMMTGETYFRSNTLMRICFFQQLRHWFLLAQRPQRTVWCSAFKIWSLIGGESATVRPKPQRPSSIFKMNGI